MVEVNGTPVDVDLSEGIMVGIGEETLFVDLTEGVALAPDLLTEAGIALPTTLDI